MTPFSLTPHFPLSRSIGLWSLEAAMQPLDVPQGLTSPCQWVFSFSVVNSVTVVEFCVCGNKPPTMQQLKQQAFYRWGARAGLSQALLLLCGVCCGHWWSRELRWGWNTQRGTSSWGWLGFSLSLPSWIDQSPQKEMKFPACYHTDEHPAAWESESRDITCCPIPRVWNVQDVFHVFP